MIMKKFVAASLACCAAAGSIGMALTSRAPAQGMAVFDVSNYSQNLLVAARTLSQVNNQITQLQNEAKMLANMGKHLSKIDFPQLQQLRTKMEAIDKLMGEAQG